MNALDSPFPLPRSYVPISREELEVLSLQNNLKAVQEFLNTSKDYPQAHFTQVFTPHGFVSVFPSKQRIPIQKNYSNAFVQLIKMNAYSVKSGVLSYHIEQNKFLSFKQSKAFKLKIKSNSGEGDIFTTHYLVTTPRESFIMVEYSKNETDLQSALATYILKNS